MLKIMKILILLLAVLLTITPLVIQAQTGAEVPGADNPLDYFASLPGLAALVLFITEFIKNKTGWLNFRIQLASLAVALLLAAAGWYFQLGIFVDLVWWYIFVYGTAAALIANGIFTYPSIKKLLEAFRLRKKPEAING